MQIPLKFILTTILISFVLPLALMAQKPKVENDPTHDDKPIHFGFSLGLNTMDYKIELDEAATTNNVYVGLSKLQPGINIHAITNLRLAENFDLRALPGISFGERWVYFVNALHPDSIYNDGVAYKSASSFLELPVSLKYKSKRLNNFRPYLLGGVNFRYDLAVKGEYDAKDQLFAIKKPDVYAEIGYGMDFYLTYFKFGVELKYSMGLTNIMKKADDKGPPDADLAMYTNSIKSITAHMIILSFHFE